MQTIQDKLAQLRLKYIENLDGRRQAISTLFQQVLEKWESEPLAELYRLVHSVKGSSATFGLTIMSQSAEVLESALMSAMVDYSDPDTATRTHLQSLFDRLNSVMMHPEKDRHDEPKPRNPALATQAEKKSRVLVSERLTILLTDDEEFGREQVSLMLREAGHEVIQAPNGMEAIFEFQQRHPDLVIMDVVMPEMNGYEAARKLKELSGQHFVPIIFLTGLTDETELVQCIENGGDDFLIKPVNPAILHARIYAMQRIRELNNMLYEYQERTEEEITLAKHIFERVTTRGLEQHSRIASINEPAGHFSGDLFISTAVGEGRYYAMVGDFTGHGLTAAIGAIPASDIFHTLSRKNAPLYVIAEEINSKLNLLLPTSHFLACTLIAVDFRSHDLSVLNCGLPPSYLFGGDGSVTQEFKSKNLAFGILKGNQYRDSVVNVEGIAGGSHFLCASDGLVEAHNHGNELFGTQRLFDAVKAAAATDFLPSIRRALGDFIGSKVQHDDITLMTISF